MNEKKHLDFECNYTALIRYIKELEYVIKKTNSFTNCGDAFSAVFELLKTDTYNQVKVEQPFLKYTESSEKSDSLCYCRSEKRYFRCATIEVSKEDFYTHIFMTVNNEDGNAPLRTDLFISEDMEHKLNVDMVKNLIDKFFSVFLDEKIKRMSC
jgi:hypothetical protein